MTWQTNSVDDRELENVLAGRAAHAARVDDQELLVALRTHVAATRQDRLVPLVPVAWERVAWLGTVAVALVIGLTAGLVGPRWLQGIGETALPSASTPGASPVGSASPVASASVGVVAGVMPAAQLGAGLASGALRSGDTVLVRGTLAVDPTCSTPTFDACATRVIDGLPDAVLIDRLPQPQRPTGEPSISAVRVTDDRDPSGRRYLELLTDAPRLGSGDAPFAVDVLATMPASSTVTYVVHGWLAALPAFRCPAAIGSSPQPDRIESCGSVTDFLTPNAFQAVVREPSGMRVVAPAVAIGLEPGDYQAFAPNPARDDGGVVVPREGTYLMRIERQGELPRGRIVGRLGPATVPVPQSPEPTATVAPSSDATGLTMPMLPEQLAAAIRQLDGQLAIVQGHMDPERLPCPTGPAGCWAGRLAGHDGPPIFAAADADPGWQGGASGFLVLRVEQGVATYVGSLRPRDERVGPWRTSELGRLDPSDAPGWLYLAEGSVSTLQCGAPDRCLYQLTTPGTDPTSVLLSDRPTGPPVEPGLSGLMIVQPMTLSTCETLPPDSLRGCAGGPIAGWGLVGALTGESDLRAQPVPTCDRVDGDLCATLAARAVGDAPNVVAIDVQPFVTSCQPNARCAAVPYTHAVSATRGDGSGQSWLCAAGATDVSCETLLADELRSLATVRIVVDGVASRYVVFFDANGGSFDLTVDGTKTVQLTRGRWEMYSAEVAPPGPLNDLCPSSLQIEPGAQLELRISVTNGICSHEVGPDASPRS